MKRILSVIWSFVSSLIFGKGPGIINPDGPHVVRTYVETKGNQKFLVTVYSDGSMSRTAYNENDPTDVGGFIDGLGR